MRMYTFRERVDNMNMLFPKVTGYSNKQISIYLKIKGLSQVIIAGNYRIMVIISNGYYKAQHINK